MIVWLRNLWAAISSRFGLGAAAGAGGALVLSDEAKKAAALALAAFGVYILFVKGRK